MKLFCSGLLALAAAAVIALPACSGSAKTEATDTDTTATEAPEAPAPEVASGPVIELPAGTANLDAYAGKLIVIDFNAVWCGPCRQYGPTFHAVAEKMADKATFLSVNVDSCRSIADVYVGQFIPQTSIITPDGRHFSKTNQLDEATLIAFIDSVAAL